MRECVVETPIGLLHITEENDKIIEIDVCATGVIKEPCSDLLRSVCSELSEYFEGERSIFTFPTDAQGTEFQKGVWKKLRELPYGQITTYGELAKRLGRPSSARAVGNAVGKNPLLIVIPCHRVCGGNGKLGGFSAGIEIKKALLRLEGIKVTEDENEEKL